MQNESILIPSFKKNSIHKKNVNFSTSALFCYFVNTRWQFIKMANDWSTINVGGEIRWEVTLLTPGDVTRAKKSPQLANHFM